MNSLKSLIIELFDLFSFGFSFTVNKKSRIATWIGALFSFIILIILIIFFFLLGENFLYSKNPNTSTSSYQQLNYSVGNISEDYSTIVISFTRRESWKYYPPLVNITDFLYSKLAWSNATYNTTLNITVFKSAVIPLIECPKDFLKKYSFNPGNYYCLNLSQYPEIYADENQDNYKTFKFTISGCKGSASYPSNRTCTPITELDKYFKEYFFPSYFSIYYPTHFYDPNDHSNPSKIVYKYTTFPFDHNLQRTDYLYFRETIVEDDRGWLFSDKKNSSYWTVEERDYFYQYKTNDIITTSTSASNLYTLYIYQSKNVVYHTRSYMKLTELLSYIFCYIRIITSIVAFCFSFLVNPIVLKFSLMRIFFGKGHSNTHDQDLVRSINFTTKPTVMHTSSLQKINESQNSQNLINQSVLQKKNCNMENSGLALNNTVMNNNHQKNINQIKK